MRHRLLGWTGFPPSLLGELLPHRFHSTLDKFEFALSHKFKLLSILNAEPISSAAGYQYDACALCAMGVNIFVLHVEENYVRLV